jgi:hypothetical protein
MIFCWQAIFLFFIFFFCDAKPTIKQLIFSVVRAFRFVVYQLPFIAAVWFVWFLCSLGGRLATTLFAVHLTGGATTLLVAWLVGTLLIPLIPAIAAAFYMRVAYEAPQRYL